MDIFNFELSNYTYNKLKNVIIYNNNIKPQKLLYNNIKINNKECKILNDAKTLLFGTNQRFMFEYIKTHIANNKYITVICYMGDENDYNIPLIAYVCSKLKLKFELYFYYNNKNIEYLKKQKIIQLTTFFKNNIDFYIFNNKNEAKINIEKNNNIYKLIINNSFDDTAINLLYSNIYNNSLDDLISQKNFIWVFVKSIFNIKYILKLFKYSFLFVVLEENNNIIIDFINNINKIIGYRIKIIDRLDSKEEQLLLKNINYKFISNNNDGLLFVYWNKYGTDSDFIFNSYCDNVFMYNNNENIKIMQNSNDINIIISKKNNIIDISGDLIRYNKESFNIVKNNINNIFSYKSNDYYIKDNNSYIYVYKIKNIPVIICLVSLTDFCLIRLVKVNEKFKTGGYCSFFINKIINDVFIHFNIKYFILYVDINNLSALRCYTKVGFIINGIMFFHGDKYYKMEYFKN